MMGGAAQDSIRCERLMYALSRARQHTACASGARTRTPHALL